MRQNNPDSKVAIDSRGVDSDAGIHFVLSQSRNRFQSPLPISALEPESEFTTPRKPEIGFGTDSTGAYLYDSGK